jgi:hypothetical protein
MTVFVTAGKAKTFAQTKKGTWASNHVPAKNELSTEV